LAGVEVKVMTREPNPDRNGRRERSVPVIGITGGVASGKSTVSRMFADLGAEIIDADAIVQELLDSPEIIARLRAEWGDGFLDTEGRPDRWKIAERVFQEPERLKEWTGWVLPPVREKMRKLLDSALQNSGNSVIILDAPLLLEAGIESWCDAILFVDANPSLRAERARASRGWPEDEVKRRESLQSPLDAKHRRADVVVSNNGPREETFRQVERLFRQWTDPIPGSENPSSHVRR